MDPSRRMAFPKSLMTTRPLSSTSRLSSFKSLCTTYRNTQNHTELSQGCRAARRYQRKCPFACTHLQCIHNTYTCTCTMQYVRDECAGSTSQRASPLPTAQLYWAVSEDIVITDSYCATYTQLIHTFNTNPTSYTL